MGFNRYIIDFNAVMQSELAYTCKNFVARLMGTKYKSGTYIGLPDTVKNQLAVDWLVEVLNADYKDITHSACVLRPVRIASYDVKSACDNIRLIVVVEQLDGSEQKTPDSALDKQVGGGHYKSMKIQPVDFITANNIGYVEGNIIKYVCRYKNKNGVEDLKKAQHYLQMLIEQEEKTKES